MNCAKRVPIVVLLVCGLCQGRTSAQEPTLSERKLVFEIGEPGAIAPQDAVYGVARGRSDFAPAYVAVFEVSLPEPWIGKNDSSLLSMLSRKMLGTRFAQEMSEDQKAVVWDKPWLRYRLRPEYEGTRIIHIAAVGEQDARLCVQAFLAALDDEVAAKRQETQREIERLLAGKAENEAKLPECVARLKAMEDEIPKLQQKLHLPLEGQALQSTEDELRRSVLDSSNQLRGLDVDQAGTKAKIDAITKARPAQDNDTTAALDRQLIALEVEMAEILARRQAISESQESAAHFVNRMQEQRDLSARKADIESSIHAYKQRVADEESALKELAQPEVVDNKVVIYPLKDTPKGDPKESG
jgi:predicted nuclease with TOPRIM domain